MSASSTIELLNYAHLTKATLEHPAAAGRRDLWGVSIPQPTGLPPAGVPIRLGRVRRLKIATEIGNALGPEHLLVGDGVARVRRWVLGHDGERGVREDLGRG